MKITVVFALTFLTNLMLALAQESDAGNAVLQTERDLATAYLKSDTDGIAQGVMEDYTLANSTGKITTRADDIGEAKKTDPKYEIFENYDMKVRVHGDAAVVTGKTHTKGISGGKPFNSRFQFTGTIVKDGGRWRLLASHASKLPAKEKQIAISEIQSGSRPPSGLARKRASVKCNRAASTWSRRRATTNPMPQVVLTS
jgi:ketosteroid isomerase-like protein